MSGITLSSSVRQNLLSLQSTADLLSTTQSRLSTGNKVNSALDNPTNFFTAQGLNNRASDINNLLDGIGNGVQILQAANTGITSLQKLVDSAKSIANQALQTTVGYTKSSATAATGLAGATAANLLGSSSPATAGVVTAGAFAGPLNVSAAGGSASAATIEGGTYTPIDFSGSNTLSFDISIDGAAATSVTLAAADFTGAGNTAAVTGAEFVAAINTKLGGGTAATFAGGKVSFTSGTTGTGSSVAITNTTGSAGVATAAGISNASDTGSAAGTADSVSFSVAVDGGAAQTVTLSAATIATYNTAHSGATVNAASLSAADVAAVATSQLTGVAASAVGGKLTFTSATTGTTSSVTTTAATGTATSGTTGVAADSKTGAAAVAGLTGTTLQIAATVTGGTATNITFGTAAGEISTLDGLNAELGKNNLQASIDTAGKLSITTTNDYASVNIGAISGTATDAGGPLAGLTAGAAQKDATSQATRASLVAQYNQVIDNITNTAQDSSFNGVNLLNGDTLKLTFNETGKSTLSIQGVSFGPDGLGLSSLTSGGDFIDNASTNKVLASLNKASTQLRSQASAFGSNLSIVQMRQDFSKQMINVLQTGASNLTLADTNEEAANSQALSTRQSIAVSALSLANQSQQGVLQLLR